MIPAAYELNLDVPIRAQPCRCSGQKLVPVENDEEGLVRPEARRKITPCPCWLEIGLSFRPPIPQKRIGNSSNNQGAIPDTAFHVPGVPEVTQTHPNVPPAVGAELRKNSPCA